MVSHRKRTQITHIYLRVLLAGNLQDWSPHMSFILKGSHISTLQLKDSFKSKTSIQEYRNENTKLILNLCMNYVVHVSSTMWRIKNQPSNSTSCSDNALRLLVLVAGKLYWGLQVTSSFSIWGCVLKGCFERGIFWRAKLRLKGIEDFNLWTLLAVHLINTKVLSGLALHINKYLNIYKENKNK